MKWLTKQDVQQFSYRLFREKFQTQCCYLPNMEERNILCSESLWHISHLSMRRCPASEAERQHNNDSTKTSPHASTRVNTSYIHRVHDDINYHKLSIMIRFNEPSFSTKVTVHCYDTSQYKVQFIFCKCSKL